MSTSFISTKAGSLSAWGADGYLESWDGYDRNYTSTILGFIDTELGNQKEKSTLEIGSGGGFWTGLLLERSKDLVAIDVIDKPARIDSRVRWIVRADREYNCAGVDDQSIDFVFCFGVFCHFPLTACESYLRDIHRVLKPGGVAILMYGDSIKCPEFTDYNTKELTLVMVAKFDFDCTSLLEFRDTLLLLRKR